MVVILAAQLLQPLADTDAVRAAVSEARVFAVGKPALVKAEAGRPAT
jgi:hypothetical protein